VNVFTDGLTRRYGPATSLDDYERKAQAMTTTSTRDVRAYGRTSTLRRRDSVDAQHSWPSLIWHLYDYYLVPRRIFGTKKAMEPVHVQYGYDDHSVAVVNDTRNAVPGVKVSATIYNLDATQVATDGGR